MITRVQATKSFSRDIRKVPESIPDPPPLLTFLGPSPFEDTQIWNHIRHSSGFITPEPSIAKVFNSESRLSTTAYCNLHLLLCNTILLTLRTCNTPSLKWAIIHGIKFPDMQSWLISASDHGYYNKSSTYRLCSYNHPPIPRPHQHPWQAHMILLLLKKGSITFLILRAYTQKIFLFLSSILLH